MSNYAKSAIVIVVWVALVTLLAALVVPIIRGRHSKLVLRLLVAASLIPLLVGLAPYMNGNDVQVDLKLCHTLSDKTNQENRPLDSLEWYAIYEEYGLGTESRYNQNTISWVDWPELDLENYTYIISFGREITSLSYNIWESKGMPLLDLGTNFKVGEVEFAEKVDTSLVYVYQIPKMRIDRYLYC